MANTLEFLRGVDRLHAFYTENVRMLAHAYDLTDEEASHLLANMGFNNVSVSILRPPRVDLLGGLGERPVDEVHTHPVVDPEDAPRPGSSGSGSSGQGTDDDGGPAPS